MEKDLSLLPFSCDVNMHVCSCKLWICKALFLFWQSWTRTEGSSLSRPTLRSSFLEGGASGRLPRQFHTDIVSVSGRWWAHANAPTDSLKLHKFPFPTPTWYTVLDQTPDLLKLCQINKVYGSEVKGQRTVEYYMQYGTLCNMVLMLQWRKCSEGSLELLHCACIWSRQIYLYARLRLRHSNSLHFKKC